jgi:hypothetical protein
VPDLRGETPAARGGIQGKMRANQLDEAIRPMGELPGCCYKTADKIAGQWILIQRPAFFPELFD